MPSNNELTYKIGSSNNWVANIFSTAFYYNMHSELYFLPVTVIESNVLYQLPYQLQNTTINLFVAKHVFCCGFLHFVQS
jgi:hypothetical protein